MRSRRGTRPISRNHRVTERDLELLIHLARGRALTSRQLVHLMEFKTPSALHRRVRALHALGLLRVHVLAAEQPNIVTLTAKGAALVEQEGLAREDIHVARRVVRREAHAEMIGDLRVGVLLMARRRADIEVESFLSDFDLARAVGRRARDAYIPDALVALRVTGEPFVLAYELDRGFEPGAVIRRKVTTTVALARNNSPLYGFAPWRPVLLASSERRLATLSRHIVAAQGGELWACGLLEARHEPDGPCFALAAEIAESQSPAASLVRRLIPGVS